MFSTQVGESYVSDDCGKEMDFVKGMEHLKKMQDQNVMEKPHVKLKMEEEDVTVIKVTREMEFKNVKVSLCLQQNGKKEQGK